MSGTLKEYEMEIHLQHLISVHHHHHHHHHLSSLIHSKKWKFYIYPADSEIGIVRPLLKWKVQKVPDLIRGYQRIQSIYT